MTGSIEEILQQGPQWVRAMAARHIGEMGGFSVDPDLARLDPALRDEISRITDLINQLIVVVADEAEEDTKRAEGRHVLQQLQSTLEKTCREFVVLAPQQEEYYRSTTNKIITKMYDLIEQTSLTLSETRFIGRRGLKRGSGEAEGKGAISAQPSKKTAQSKDAPTRRQLSTFTRECETFLFTYKQAEERGPLSTDMSQAIDDLVSLFSSYPAIQADPSVAAKREHMEAYLREHLQERTQLKAALQSLSLRSETMAKVLALPQDKVRHVLNAVSTIEEGYLEDLRRRLHSGQSIEIQEGMPVATLRYLQGAFSGEDWPEKTLVQTMIAERMHARTEESIINEMMRSPVPIQPALQRQILNRYNLSSVAKYLQGMQEPGSKFRIQLNGVFYEARISPDRREIVLRRWVYEEWSVRKILTGWVSNLFGSSTAVPEDAFCIRLGVDGNIETITRGREQSRLSDALNIVRALEDKLISEQTPMQIEQEKLGLHDADLITFRAIAIQDQRTLLEGESKTEVLELGAPQKMYRIWSTKLKDGFAINIQDEASQGTLLNKIGLQISEDGKLVSVYANDTKVAALSDSQRDLISEAFIKTLQHTSMYMLKGSDIFITAVMRSPRQVPLYHLQQLAHCLEERSKNGRAFPEIFVRFRLDDLTEARGVDAGGLSRTYLDDLFQGIVEQGQPISFAGGTTRYTPFPAADHEQIYQQMGAVFMWCYTTRYIIGDHFNPGLFAAALSLSSEQIDETPLQDVTRQKMQDAFLRTAAESEPESIWSALEKMRDMEHFLEGWTATDENIAVLQHIIRISSYDEDSMSLIGEITSREQVLPILQKEPHLRTDEENDVLKTLVAQAQSFVSTKFSAYLNELCQDSKIDFDAIREIARGMKQYCALHPKRPAWDVVRGTAPVEFSSTVQGTTNRAKVIESLSVASDAPEWLVKKANFLKEWIADPSTTDEELRQFLKWVTGSAALPARRIVLNSVGQGYCIPACHTCSCALDICETPYGLDAEYPYDTKEGFLHYITLGMKMSASFDFL